MIARGLTEDDIMRDLMGGKQNKDALDKGQGIEMDLSKMNVSPELLELFDKHMKDNGADAELSHIFDLMEQEAEKKKEDESDEVDPAE